MQEIVAFCGLTCTRCAAYLATQNDNDEERRRVAETRSQQYNSDIKPEDINCDGCLPGHTRYFHHRSACDIRACGVARKVENCACCDDYFCERLEHFYRFVPAARTRLDSIPSRLALSIFSFASSISAGCMLEWPTNPPTSALTKPTATFSAVSVPFHPTILVTVPERTRREGLGPPLSCI